MENPVLAFPSELWAKIGHLSEPDSLKFTTKGLALPLAFHSTCNHTSIPGSPLA